MDTGDGLLQAIVDEPDDDSLRLIYADWLQDHDQPDRAEFIRVEIAMHARWPDTDGSAPEEYDDPEYHRLAARQGELVAGHKTEWFGAIARLVDRYQTARGFVFYIDTTARRFATKADEIFAAAPLVEQIYFDRLGKNIPAVARRPELVRIREIGFYATTLDTADVRALCRSPHIRNLRRFAALEGRLGPDAGRALASSTNLPNLEEMALSDNPLWDDGAVAILRSPNLPRLRRLVLNNCGLTDDTAWSLAGTSDRPGLTELDLGYNQLTPVGVRSLASAARLASLERLLLFGNNVGAGVRALATSPHLRCLRELHLGWASVEDTALVELLQSSNLASVEELMLARNPLGPASFAALGTSRMLERVRDLSLFGCHLDVAALRHLARARMPCLRSLNLSENPLDQRLGVLLASDLLVPVTTLYLAECQLGDAGAEVIAGAEVLANLRSLSLRATQIGNVGALALARSPYLDRLGYLDLSGNRIGKRAAKALMERFGEKACHL